MFFIQNFIVTLTVNSKWKFVLQVLINLQIVKRLIKILLVNWHSGKTISDSKTELKNKKKKLKCQTTIYLEFAKSVRTGKSTLISIVLWSDIVTNALEPLHVVRFVKNLKSESSFTTAVTTNNYNLKKFIQINKFNDSNKLHTLYNLQLVSQGSIFFLWTFQHLHKLFYGINSLSYVQRNFIIQKIHLWNPRRKVCSNTLNNLTTIK